jgi:hypothetical protein
VLAQQLVATTPQDDAQGEGDGHGIVEVTGHRDEVRHEVEREREISDERSEQQLVPPAYAWVAEQTPEEHDGVAYEGCYAAHILPAAGDDEREDESRVDDQDASRGEQRPLE